MPGQKDDDPRETGSMAKAYPKILLQIMERAGLSRSDVVRLGGIDKNSVYNILPAKSDDPVSRSPVTARKVSEAIQRAKPGLKVPPPVLPIETLEQWEWFCLGEELLRERPEVFAEAMSLVKEWLQGIAKANEARSALREFAARGTSPGDDSNK